MQITNPVTPQNTPYWQEIRKLNKDEKIQLLALISTSLVEESQSQAAAEPQPASAASAWTDRFAGKWQDSRSASQLLDDIHTALFPCHSPVCP